MREILITGAGSGFGEGTALGLAQKGHRVIAAVQTWPQVTALREKARSLSLQNTEGREARPPRFL
jgi:NADP-dependent 3-hydroxy acid dehydrogenase YdfG